MIVLDTHAWIWLLEGDSRINKKPILTKIYKNIPTRSIFVSEISAWEVAMLVSKKRIKISGSLVDWIHEGQTAPGIQSINLTPEIISESVSLPDSFHGDPADRLIVATARILKAELVTMDKAILRYSKKGNVKTLSLNSAKPKR
ncbi:PIN domain protein [Leptospira inadai serovar Lyme str. 10]|uniref:PIN domain protein n=2 Tax=Leptospira inadai serovar Lyme TaxID=293084 RepID=V6H9F2_9LEPT|nr:type II toxin-antitoxin system VapC family toxin [Leptospira inadai]EQA35592.1 PIN domain protein [Leptospira inadai serovar Lyme str. 10]PNV76131.1 PIN domain nuclease [Leptospira inadai serovar Lyme]